MMPVHYASYSGHLECALALLRHMIEEKHIDIQRWPTKDPLEAILDKSGQTPVCTPATEPQISCAQRLCTPHRLP